jgi:hypothetical protein
VSAALIQQLAAADCFQPAFDLDQLSERHVDFDILVGDQRHEHALTELLVREQPTRIAVSGPAGSGKSSLIAATLAQMPTHLPLPIGIAMADLAILENQTNFAQFILAEILRQARDQFTIQDRIRRAAKKIERAAADEITHSPPHLGLTAKVTLPVPHPAMPALAEIAGEVTTAATSTTTKANPTQVLTGISEVMRVFAHDRMPTPVLIIDDADKWGSAPDTDEVEPRAQALFTTALQPLLAADFHLVVAVQDRWRTLPAYANLEKRLAETITIPEFTPDATAALRQIIARHAGIAPTGIDGVDGLLDQPALTRLEAEYDHTGRDLRKTLRILRDATRGASRGTPVPDLLGHIDIRAAAQAL